MYELKGKMIGIVPILFNRLLDEAKIQIEERKSGRKKTREESIQQAYEKVYRQDGYLGVPALNVKKALLEGSSMLKQKRQRTALCRYLQGAVFFKDSFLSFGVSEPDLIHEETGRRPPKTGAPIQIFRPAIREGWELSFILVVYEDTIADSEIKDAFEYTGLMVGICEHRPEYGRFRIEWEE